ncbi:MAG: hypothetical protein ACR2FF_08930 [Mycobacteriales bacterium]
MPLRETSTYTRSHEGAQQQFDDEARTGQRLLSEVYAAAYAALPWTQSGRPGTQRVLVAARDA